MKETIEYAIKFIHPDWYFDSLRKQRVGFPARERGAQFVNGAQLIVYLTTAQKDQLYVPGVREYERKAVGIYTVLSGDFKDGEKFPDKKPGYPLNLPVVLDYEKNDPRDGLSYEELTSLILDFRPRRGQSHQAITEEEFLRIQRVLKT
ncbi:hypothetical protein IM538_18620 [Cytobacillus suaedae]|nr:hypothetical protein IM538_18620 [Cytobacillus suaedae]